MMTVDVYLCVLPYYVSTLQRIEQSDTMWLAGS